MARALIRVSAWLAPAWLRSRWREEWLAEIAAAPENRATLTRAAGAPWDALSSRWTTRAEPEWPRLGWNGSEVRQAWRALRQSPWYALTCAGVIALSMALATTIFAIVDGVLFKVLPYPAPTRLFTVIENAYPGDGASIVASPSPVQVQAWRTAIPSAGIATYVASRARNFTLTTNRYAALLTRAMVGPEFFDTLRVAPLTGGFATEDFARSSRAPAAIVSYEFWQQWGGGDPSAIGRSIVNEQGSGIRVVGVLPRGFLPPWGFTST